MLLSVCFVFVTIVLTFYSLLYTHPPSDHGSTSSNRRVGGARALFSFPAPSSLFPPSAIISLTDDNSTFFLSRPAAFGPALPAEGLSGQLWVGSGFGDDSLVRGGASANAEGELGCSAMLGWSEETGQYKDEHHEDTTPNPKGGPNTPNRKSASASRQRRSVANAGSMLDKSVSDSVAPREDDGTDDYLHYPLQGAPLVKGTRIGKQESNSQNGQHPEHADIQSLQESAEIAGKVVLLSRGGCGFLEKVKWAQRRGGVAVIVGDNTRGGPLVNMYARGDTSNVTIPSLFTSRTTAHLLSSLIPASGRINTASLNDDMKTEKSQGKGAGKQNGKKAKNLDRPTFTPVNGLTKPTTIPRPANGPSQPEPNVSSGSAETVKAPAESPGWFRSLAAAFGLGGRSSNSGVNTESRRPPSSGRNNWVLSDDWNDEPPSKSKKGSTKVTGDTKFKPTNKAGQPDDFVIGVQDWRDPDLVPTKGNNEKDANAPVSDSTASLNGNAPTGGSRAPGSGVYGSSQHDNEVPQEKQEPKTADSKSDEANPAASKPGWLGGIFGGPSAEDDPAAANKEAQDIYKKKVAPLFVEDHEFEASGSDLPVEHEGLWVTMTPTSMSTSPFFDTLLVLVVSPLVTLTVVYALLLLRSRIRRRRWRAPKSVVDRLPIRTYHTMSCSSSSTSSQTPSLEGSSPSSPLLQPKPRSILTRTRPRSRTTSVIGHEASGSLEHTPVKSPLAREKVSFPRKKYSGKQVECVVCLEEYIDGQSRVMSLPCGHEFHAECM